MKQENRQKGIGVPAVIAILALVAVIGGVVYYNTRPVDEIMSQKAEDMMREGEQMVEKGSDMMSEGEKMMEEVENMRSGSDEEVKSDPEEVIEAPGQRAVNNFEGEVLAGNKSFLLDFNSADYKKALQSDKLIALYFYANWCPTCKVEFPKMQEAFDELETNEVVGFRVNFNDSQTDSFEKGLAREFGVAYQHTKVFVRNGERILKSPESWEKDRYLSEIERRL